MLGCGRLCPQSFDLSLWHRVKDMEHGFPNHENRDGNPSLICVLKLQLYMTLQQDCKAASCLPDLSGANPAPEGAKGT